MRPTRWFRRVGWVALVAAVAACAPEPEPPAEIRIGLLAISGHDYAATSRTPTLQGAALAVSEINADGGVIVDGRPHRLTLVVQDFANRPDAAATQARTLINQRSIDALVGPQLSAHAIAVARIAEAARLPMISPMSSNPETTEGKRFVFRMAFLDGFQSHVMASFARRDLHATRAAVLYDEANGNSRGLATLFSRSFEAEGGSIVARVKFTTDHSGDFSAELREIARVAPDILYIPNTAKVAAAQMREARAMGIRAVFLGGDSWDLQSLRTEDYAEGSYLTHQWHYDAPGEGVGPFVQRYETTYGGKPRTTAAMTYDALKVLATAMDRAGSTDPDAVREEIATMTDYTGATGVVAFHGTGDPERSVVISRLLGGEIVVSAVIDPSPDAR
jgi:branched-chain amino acid transport system substrate-binding protein